MSTVHTAGLDTVHNGPLRAAGSRLAVTGGCDRCSESTEDEIHGQFAPREPAPKSLSPDLSPWRSDRGIERFGHFGTAGRLCAEFRQNRGETRVREPVVEELKLCPDHPKIRWIALTAALQPVRECCSDDEDVHDALAEQ
jgi:hypothetical protein